MKTFASIVITLVLVGAASAVPPVSSNSTQRKATTFANVRLVKPKEAPYTVFLFSSTRRLFCAGAIIHPNWVLTAANCLTNTTFRVVAGMQDLNELNDVDEVDEIDDFDIQIRTIPNDKHYIVHELYENEVGNVDIAMIYIAEPFDLQSSLRVKKVNLPTEEHPQEGVGKLFGWGIGSGTLNHMDLFVMETYIIGFDECRDYVGSDDVLMPFNICTPNQTGPCAEDSGAPLVRATPNGDMLVGLATWPKKLCHSMTGPSLYTNVLVFTDWIKGNMLEHLVLPIKNNVLPPINNASVQTNVTSSIRLAKQNEAPYSVYLLEGNRGLFCSGVIIHPNFVLTAANCLKYNTITVVAGVHDLNELHNKDPTKKHPEIQIRTIPNTRHYIVHTLYDNSVGNVDIGMIYIRIPFNLRSTPLVKLIELPTEEYPLEGVGKLFGWGFGSRRLDHLYAIDTVVVGFDQCSVDMDYDEKLMPYNICTSGEYGPCAQDSGAPLVRSTPGGDVLVGLATWPTKECHPMTEPAMYSNVFVFNEWIRENIFRYMMNIP